MPVIFHGDERLAYRDPACYYFEGEYHLFFTVSEKDGGYMYNRVAHSVSRDLRSFSEPEMITEKNCATNFSSPGNVIKRGEEYLICVTSYPMRVPFAERSCADETARLFFIKTTDFRSFSAPERIWPKGRGATDEGRMIDPYVLEQGGEYLLYFKQNGVSTSRSCDLSEWEFLGNTEGGENVCVLPHGDGYIMLHSPENGIGVRYSADLIHWEDRGVCTLDQERWDFAGGRLTAAFAMPIEGGEHKYAVLFHGSRADAFPETHGEASLALCYTDDFSEYYF